MLIGGIEAGGTKIVCGAAEVTEEGIHILDRMRFATGRPEEAVRKAADYFKDFPDQSIGRCLLRAAGSPEGLCDLRPYHGDTEEGLGAFRSSGAS